MVSTDVKAPRINEDLIALGLGLLVFFVALPGIVGFDLLGWVVNTTVWTDVTTALVPVSKAYAALGGVGALLATYVALLVTLTGSAVLLGEDPKRFALAFTVLFLLAYGSWVVGSFAHIASVTPADFKKYGIDWSLKLTNEAGYLVALVVGLVIANFFPSLAAWLKAAARPELYVKVSIVILGGALAVTAAGKLSFASNLLLRGVAAIIEAYLIYWSVVYYIARKYFKFNREWAVPLASGISICGVAAAIATGGAIRARPSVPVLVSSLVVVFAVVEVLILPVLAETFLSDQPLVAAAWMGLAVKTDGAALAAGGINEALILAKASAQGINYQPGWLLATTAAVKVFIDVFIGIWAFILGYIWTNYINVTPDAQKAKPSEIWQRFPKFILGYVLTFALGLLIALQAPKDIAGKLPAAIGEAGTFRVIFFILTFFSIGILSNFKSLWKQGIGKLAAVYVVSLFGFVVWVGLIISWLFFSGVKPPLVG